MRLASHRSRKAFAAKRQRCGSVNADTTYVIAFMSGEEAADSGVGEGCVVNHDA